LHYRQVDGSLELDFVTGPDGAIRYLATDYIPAVEIFQRVPGYRSLGTVGTLVGLALALVFGTLLTWLMGAIVRRHYKKPLSLPPDLARTRLLSRLGTLAVGGVILGWLLLVVAASADESVLLGDNMSLWLYLLYALGIVALLGVLAVLVHSVRSQYRGPRSGWVRVGEALLGLAVLYIAWFLGAFGMLSFSVRF
jgi:hypothetical protein